MNIKDKFVVKYLMALNALESLKTHKYKYPIIGGIIGIAIPAVIVVGKFIACRIFGFCPIG